MSIEPKRLIPDYMPGDMPPPRPPAAQSYSREQSYLNSRDRWGRMSIPELRMEHARLRAMGSSNLAMPCGHVLQERVEDAKNYGSAAE